MADDKTELNAEVNDRQQASFVMLNCLLLTRIPDESPGETEPAKARAAETGAKAEAAGAGQDQPAPANPPAKQRAAAIERERYHEEISTYLRSLSAGFSNPANAEHLKPYLFDYDIDALKRLVGSGDAALRYVICRAANDVLILSVGIFNERDEAPKAVQGRQGPPDYRHGTQGQMGRGETYFHFAFSYAHKVADPAEAVSSASAKISTGLEKYATILAYVTGRPFELPARMKDCEVYVFSRSVETTGKQLRLERRRNEFLDAYLEWKGHPTKEAQAKLEQAARELKRLDPTFNYAPEAE